MFCVFLFLSRRRTCTSRLSEDVGTHATLSRFATWKGVHRQAGCGAGGLSGRAYVVSLGWRACSNAHLVTC